jgi:hypothetical protein
MTNNIIVRWRTPGAKAWRKRRMTVQQLDTLIANLFARFGAAFEVRTKEAV